MRSTATGCLAAAGVVAAGLLCGSAVAGDAAQVNNVPALSPASAAEAAPAPASTAPAGANRGAIAEPALPGQPLASEEENQGAALEDRAANAFAEGQYGEAAELLKQGYELTHRTTFLFNLGVAYHWLGECNVARDYYELYLKQEPRGESAEQATSALESLYGVCGRSAPPPPDSPPPPPPPQAPPPGSGEKPPVSSPPPDRPLTNNAWREVAAPVLLGVGTATTLAFVFTLVRSAQIDDEVDRRYEQRQPWDSELERDGDRYNAMTLVFGVTSGALLGLGTGLLLFDLGPRGSVSAAGPGQAGLSYQSVF